MTQIKFELNDGLVAFGKTHRTVVVRSSTAGDIIDATADAERVIFAPDGPAIVASPTLVGVNVTRRRIVSIGDIKGPLALDMFRELSGDDLGLIQAKCDELDKAHGREAAKQLEKLGRDEGAGATG